MRSCFQIDHFFAIIYLSAYTMSREGRDIFQKILGQDRRKDDCVEKCRPNKCTVLGMRNTWVCVSEYTIVPFSIPKFGEFPLIPVGYPAEILRDSRNSFHVMRSTEFALALDSPERLATCLAGGELGTEQNLIVFRGFEYFGNELGHLPASRQKVA